MNAKERRLKSIKRWFAAIAGVALFFIGAVTFPLPIPTGLILMAMGVSLMTLNPLMLRWLRHKRANSPKLDRFMGRLIPHTPGFLRRPLQRTGRRLRKSSGTHQAQ